MRRGDGRACIKRMRSIGRRLEEIVESARRRLGAMIERGQRAVLVGADPKGLPRRRPMSHRTKHLLATQHQLDRFTDHAGRHDAEHLRAGDHAFGAEAAAEERTADMDLVRGDPEQSRDAPLRQRKTLARRIDRQRIAIPCGDDRMWLHGVVILRSGLVGCFDALCGCGETGLDIAAMRCRRMARADDGWHEDVVRVEPDPRRLGVVARRQQRCAFRCGFERFRDDDGDRLIGVTDPVALQQIEPEHEGIGFFVGILRQRRLVGRRHDLDDARDGLSRRRHRGRRRGRARCCSPPVPHKAFPADDGRRRSGRHR